jgi:hypothetical protein
MIGVELENSILSAFKEYLLAECSNVLSSSASTNTIKTKDDSIFQSITDSFKSFTNYLPDSEYTQEWMMQLVESYKDSRTVQFSEAKERFEKALFADLTSSDNISSTLKKFIEDAKKNKQSLKDLAIGGATVGSSAFIIGTVYQIIYDIINAFVTIVKYIVYGVQVAVTKVYSAITEDTTLEPVIDKSVLTRFITEFDLSEFLTEDIPNMIEGLYEFATHLIDDFIKNAEKYGQMVGYYIREIVSGSVSGSMSLFFTPYDANASLSDRIVWSITQWFNMGTLLGPIIVDIVLLFCSGGTTGVISAASKFGKIDKIADVLKFTKYSEEVLEKFKI